MYRFAGTCSRGARRAWERAPIGAQARRLDWIGVADRRGVCAQRSEHIAAQAARIERMRNSAAA